MIWLGRRTLREIAGDVWEGVRNSFNREATLVVVCARPDANNSACHCCQLRFRRELASVADRMK